MPPYTTAFGALLGHITGGHIVSDDEPGKRSFQPMNVNFGLFPELAPGSIVRPEGVKRFRGKDKTIMKRQLMARRALEDCAVWLGKPVPPAANVSAEPSDESPAGSSNGGAVALGVGVA